MVELTLCSKKLQLGRNTIYLDLLSAIHKAGHKADLIKIEVGT